MYPFYEIFDFFDDLTVATILILLTVIIHAFGLDWIMARIEKRAHGTVPRRTKVFLTAFATLGVFVLVTIHVWLWAFCYELLAVKEFQNLEDAVYFSTVTFTTLGYGDIVLKDSWRVLSGIEAANGVILLGWSTAFLFEVMTMLYPRRRQSH